MFKGYIKILYIIPLALVGIMAVFWTGGGFIDQDTELISSVQAGEIFETQQKAAEAVIKSGRACDSEDGKAICPPKSAGEKGYRLQIHMPGIGETCRYPGPASEVGKWEIKTCVYMPGDQDLRHWIRDAYRYAVGIAVALAVLMIMVGGFQWIIAGGANQKISNAQTTILAAISGLVVALGSYVVLSVLDPRLVEFEELDIAAITGMEQLSGSWCDSDYSIALRERLAKQNKTFKVKDSGGKEIDLEETKCGYEYRVVIDGKEEKGDYGSCYGRGGCKEDEGQGRDGIEACMPFGSEQPICVKAINACEKWTGMGSRDYGICKSVDDQLAYFRENFPWGCGWKKDVFVLDALAKDDCQLKKVNQCTEGKERVKCQGECVREAVEEKKLTCVDPPARSVSGASVICCKEVGTDNVASFGDKGVKECKDFNNESGIRSYIGGSEGVDNCKTHDSTKECRGTVGCVAESATVKLLTKGCQCKSCRDILFDCSRFQGGVASCINEQQCTNSRSGNKIRALVDYMNANKDNYPSLKGKDLVITSISDDYTITNEGWEKCNQQHSRPPCVHTVYSCHYGGRGQKDWSYAVDIRLIPGEQAERDMIKLVESYKENGIVMGTIYVEGDHYHVSHKACCCNSSFDPTPGDGCTEADYNKCK